MLAMSTQVFLLSVIGMLCASVVLVLALLVYYGTHQHNGS